MKPTLTFPKFLIGSALLVVVNTTSQAAEDTLDGASGYNSINTAYSTDGNATSVVKGGSGIVIVRYDGPVAGTGGVISAVSGDTVHQFTGSSTLDLSGLNLNARLGVTPTGDITGSGDLIYNGPGKLTLSGANTYSGATNVSAGTLAVSGAGSINSTSAINVAAGAKFVYNSSTALTVAPTLNGTGSNKTTFSGTGTINAVTTLDSIDDVISPGNSPGIQTYGANQIWSSFSYAWELNNWNNTVAGTNIDQIQITGTLDLSARDANRYLLNILSFDSLNASGLVGAGGSGTFAEAIRSWNILTTTGGITGSNASEWQIVPVGFQDVETGTWSIGQSGDNLVLSYTAAIPESGAALLGSLGLLALLRRRRN